MYNQNNFYNYTTSADTLGHFPPSDIMLPLTFPSESLPPPLPSLIGTDKLPYSELDAFHTSTSGCSSYGSPSSLTSYCTQSPNSLIQRSVSSHSLQKNGFCPPFSTATEFLDLEEGPVRRVFSTGDLQRSNTHAPRVESPLWNENNSIIEGMAKACRYSPEEKKERIEKYRSKRTQRNFTKKIKYACRKTLADSRPRIRGRFAKNDEVEQSCQVHTAGEEDDNDDDNWINFIDELQLPPHFFS